MKITSKYQDGKIIVRAEKNGQAVESHQDLDLHVSMAHIANPADAHSEQVNLINGVLSALHRGAVEANRLLNTGKGPIILHTGNPYELKI